MLDQLLRDGFFHFQPGPAGLSQARKLLAEAEAAEVGVELDPYKGLSWVVRETVASLKARQKAFQRKGQHVRTA